MAGEPEPKENKAGTKPYERLVLEIRRRPSSVEGRSLDEEADADRGRILFSAPFRRLQNKAQVFSLESNAAVRTRLTHSLEVASIGGYVAQQALKAFGADKLKSLGLHDRQRPVITFVEAACLLHDLGNPPFGHFGEITICDWFYQNEDTLKPGSIAGPTAALWHKYYADFTHFDGNPQGFRIISRLQAAQSDDIHGLNLTATTLAAALKYPWSSDKIDGVIRRKPGYFLTESDVVVWLAATLGLKAECRHPLAYLMEAADDIAYCVSDIEDGIEKHLIIAPDFARHMKNKIENSEYGEKGAKSDPDVEKIRKALKLMEDPVLKREPVAVQRFTPMQDFRAAIIRLLARQAGEVFCRQHDEILAGTAPPLLTDNIILDALKAFAGSVLYSSSIVRNREITAHAVISGLLDAYRPIMECDRARFELFVGPKTIDSNNRRITRESSLVSWISKKYLAVYREAVNRVDKGPDSKPNKELLERIHRMRLIVDHISGMTDEFALQSYQLISGAYVHSYRN